MKHFFAYRTQSKPGFGVVIYHGNNPDDKSQERHLGPRVVKSYEIPAEMNARLEMGECPWEELKAMFPAPVEE